MKARIVSVSHRENQPDSKWSSTPEVKKLRVYISIGEDCAEPDMFTQMIDPAQWKKYRRSQVMAIRKEMPAVLEELNVPEGTKYGFSVKAGCSCGCSPGFIAQHFCNFSAWITVELYDFTEADLAPVREWVYANDEDEAILTERRDEILAEQARKRKLAAQLSEAKEKARWAAVEYRWKLQDEAYAKRKLDMALDSCCL